MNGQEAIPIFYAPFGAKASRPSGNSVSTRIKPLVERPPLTELTPTTFLFRIRLTNLLSYFLDFRPNGAMDIPIYINKLPRLRGSNLSFYQSMYPIEWIIENHELRLEKTTDTLFQSFERAYLLSSDTTIPIS